MKKCMTSFMLSVILFLSTFHANAQKSSKKFSFGFGLEGGLVTGKYNTVYNASGGLTLRGSYKAGPGFATLTTGGIVYIPKNISGDDQKASLQIPVKGGYKYLINKNFFVMGEIGFSSFRTYFEGIDGGVASVSESGFTYAPAIGVQTGTFEASIRYESISLASTLSAAFLRIGFNF